MPKAEPQKKPTRQTQGENWSRWPRCCQRTLQREAEPSSSIVFGRVVVWDLGQMEENDRDSRRTNDPSSDDEPKAPCVVRVVIAVAVKPAWVRSSRSRWFRKSWLRLMG
jgi:hypothetical protein